MHWQRRLSNWWYDRNTLERAEVLGYAIVGTLGVIAILTYFDVW
jgi:hypothetical protein